IGSVFSSLFGPAVKRALSPYLSHGLSSAQLRVAVSSTHAAQLTVAHFPLALQPGLNAQVTDAFMDGLHRGCLVGAAVAVVAAVLVLTRLPLTPSTQEVGPLAHASLPRDVRSVS